MLGGLGGPPPTMSRIGAGGEGATVRVARWGQNPEAPGEVEWECGAGIKKSESRQSAVGVGPPGTEAELDRLCISLLVPSTQGAKAGCVLLRAQPRWRNVVRKFSRLQALGWKSWGEVTMLCSFAQAPVTTWQMFIFSQWEAGSPSSRCWQVGFS